MARCFGWGDPKTLPLEPTNAFNGLDCLFTPASQRFHDKGDESDTSSPASPSMGGHLSVPPFTECGTLSYFRRCASSSLGLFTAYVASWLAALRAFRPRVLFFLLHRCELRTTCNSFTIVACAARACHTRKRDGWRSALAMNTTLTSTPFSSQMSRPS